MTTISEKVVPTCPLCQKTMECTGWISAKENSVWWCIGCEKRVEIAPFIWDLPCETQPPLVPTVPEVDSAKRVVSPPANPGSQLKITIIKKGWPALRDRQWEGKI